MRQAMTGFSFPVRMRSRTSVPILPVSKTSCGWVRCPTMAVLKTASNFQYFDEIASGLVRADTRGPGQSDVFTLPWQRIPRPVYPLETISDWRAHSSQPGAGKG